MPFITYSLWKKSTRILANLGMDVRKRLAINVQRLRRAKDLSQEELSDRSEIHQTYLSGIETGKRNPSVLVLQRLAKGLGVDVQDLLRR